MTALACHSVTAILCIVALYATAPGRLAGALLPYSAGPLAVASLALGIAAFLRGAGGWMEQAIAGLWGVGAVSGSVHLSSPPLDLADVLRYVAVQGLFAGLAGCGVFLAVVRQLRGRSGVWDITHGVALLVLAAFFFRRGTQGLSSLSGGGLEAVAFEMRLAQTTLLACSAALVITAIGARTRESH